MYDDVSGSTCKDKLLSGVPIRRAYGYVCCGSVASLYRLSTGVEIYSQLMVAAEVPVHHWIYMAIVVEMCRW